MKNFGFGMMIGFLAVAGAAGCLMLHLFPGVLDVKVHSLISQVDEGQPTLQAEPAGPALQEWKHIWSSNMPMPELIAQVGPMSPPDNGLTVQPPPLLPTPPPLPPEPILPAVYAPAAVSPVEAKLERIMQKLEEIEKRLDALQKRKEEKLLKQADKMLEKVQQLEQRLESNGEQETAAPQPPQMGGFWINSLLWLLMENCPFPCLINVYSPDPQDRIRQMLKQSEDLGEVQEEWERIWFTDHPDHLAPEQDPGAIKP